MKFVIHNNNYELQKRIKSIMYIKYYKNLLNIYYKKIFIK